MNQLYDFRKAYPEEAREAQADFAMKRAYRVSAKQIFEESERNYEIALFSQDKKLASRKMYWRFLMILSAPNATCPHCWASYPLIYGHNSFAAHAGSCAPAQAKYKATDKFFKNRRV